MKLARVVFACVAVLLTMGVGLYPVGCTVDSWYDPSRTGAFENGRNANQIIQGPFDEVWVIARDSQNSGQAARNAQSQTPAAAQDETPGTGSLVTADLKRAFPLQKTVVNADIAGPIASVKVTQRFSNPFTERIEAVYVFPLPHDAAVNDFILETGGRRIRGMIREREEARATYESARSQGYLASLLEQQRTNIFRESVANIEPGTSVDVALTFINTSEFKNGAWEWRFPMVVGPRFNSPEASKPVHAAPVGAHAQQTATATTVQYLAPGERSGADIELQVQLDAGANITALESPMHAVDISARTGSHAHIALAANDRIPNKDFVLRYSTAGPAPSHSYVWHQGENGGTLALTIMPPSVLVDAPRGAMEVVIVLDTSGSMDGRPFDQARAAAIAVLRNLTPEDRFNIVTFSNDANTWASQMSNASSEQVSKATSYLNGLRAGGGTYLEKGMRAALALPHEEGAMRFLLFATDAFIGQEEETLRELYSTKTRDRICALGVGSSVNWAFLEDMARAGRGAVAAVGLNDDAARVAQQFLDRMRTPIMHTLSVNFEGASVTDQVPSRMDDLIAGRPVTVLAHFQGAPPRRAVLNGYVGNRAVRVPLDLGQAPQEHPAVATIWARQRIAELSLQALWENADACRREIIQTALSNNLMSPYTSFVVVDGSRVTQGTGGTTIQQPVHMPEGVRYETTVPSGGAAPNGAEASRAERSTP